MKECNVPGFVKEEVRGVPVFKAIEGKHGTPFHDSFVDTKAIRNQAAQRMAAAERVIVDMNA